MFNRFSAVLVSVMLLAACSTSPMTPPNTPGGDSGAFKVLAAATPTAGLSSLAAGDYKAVNLAVSGVVFVSGDQTTELASYSDPVNIDLLSLGSVQAELADATLPAGTYEGAQLRLVVSSASLVVEGEDGSDRSVDLKIPSGEQSGFKINLQDFTVDDVYGASVVLNFDAEKSVVKTGNGKYLLKPTVKATTAANARVKIVNAVADNLDNLIVSASGVALPGVAYGAASPYQVVPAGEVMFSAAGEAALGEAVFAPKTDYLVVVTGAVSSTYPLRALVYTDDAPESGTSLRFVHAAPSMGALDFYATAPDADLGVPLVTGLEYAQATETSLPLPAAYRLRATATGGADVLADTDVADSTLLEGKAYTVVALGDPVLGSDLELLLVNAD